MHNISLNDILEYLYDRFILTFVLCLIGAIIRETMNTMKLTSIDIKRMMASVIMSSTLMCIIVDYIELQFSIYVSVCIVVGVWSPFIMKLILNSKIMAKILSGVLSNVKNPIAEEVSEAITDAAEEVEKENTKDKENQEVKEEKSADDS